ncbi:transcriptional regulator of acetoin/glycerol metabolism [Geothermobacter ehrlichii]|uniref:Transcriptional regulator of acetoin/glycerol metabolism n=1 Tax=Geothermobacter ehrlichii TaxID=213224 RepID=A0A5D3WGV3_9BACT|nr:sigma-54-dependent Fis family transcriptional regulator [Geothermobacter ehrlichii]TYO95240.1 transcriptional regulator of acetoin/glycerol metabolism [Geothermobacter ehrlichii]
MIQDVNNKLYEAWQKFVTKKEFNREEVRDVILQSWQNCTKLGISPYQKKVNRVFTGEELQKRINENQALIKVSLPVMENLYRFVAGSGFVVTLTDKEGIILVSIGDEDVAESFAKGNFVAGADWSEASAGTNAIGLSLSLGKPIQTFSYEHFCICSHHTTCSSAPIHDPQGRIIGVLDMTGTYEKVHSHTLGMVVAASYGIEMQLESQEAWDQCHIADSYKVAIMESISEGILATDGNGIVTHANNYAGKILETAPDKIVGLRVSTFLKPSHSLQKNFDLSRKITDQEADILIKGKKKKVIITVRAITGLGIGQKGTVIILNEISRTKRLVQRMVGAESKMTFEDILGQDEKFLASVRLAKTAASSFSNVLLLGESGTGKDVFAQAIHNASQCSNGPFVAINCGAIPRELISSELFGYTEGAFTGAKRGGQPGKFELADGGTIFLDEIGEMPLELQTMLLRVVEQKAVVRIGGKEVIPVNVRLIAATNRNLKEEVEKGNFRRDLYYRLNVITIPLLPLREHKSDIPLLAEAFIQKMNSFLGKNITTVDDKVWKCLNSYDWPGNVRELYNVLERAMNIVEGSTLELETFPPELLNVKKQRSTHRNFEQLEKELITEVLDEFDGNVSRAAEKLGIARSTLYRKMEKYGLNE